MEDWLAQKNNIVLNLKIHKAKEEEYGDEKAYFTTFK